jgi:hypothetical protein
MNIADKLKTLVCYFNFTRGVGHTQTMLKGAAYSDCFILSHNNSMAKYIKEQMLELGVDNNSVRVQPLTENSLRGFRKPIAIDNALLHTLFVEALNEINRLQEATNIQSQQLNAIKAIL